MFEREFPDIQGYMPEKFSEDGTVKLLRYDLSVGLYFKSKKATTPNPFLGDNNLLHPCRSPFLENNGHYLFDLNYYSEVTLVDNPPRVCFHDPSQNPGLSLNFTDTDKYKEFFTYISSAITITSPGLPGFYSVIRFVPPLSSNPKFFTQMASMKKRFLQEEDILDICGIQNVIIPMITQFQKPTILKKEEFDECMKSRDLLVETLQHRLLPMEFKADAWCLLSGMGPIESPIPLVLESYRTCRNIWQTMTESQLRRSSKRQNDIAKITNIVHVNRKNLLTVVADESILTITFNTLMSLLILYDFLGNHIEQVITLVRIVYYIFIKSVKDGKLYEVKENVEYDSETMEAVTFWSLIYLLEKCDIKNVLLDSDNKKTRDLDYIGDLCFLIHPHLFKMLQSKGISSFASVKLIAGQLYSSFLPLNSLTDLIFHAIVSGNVYIYSQTLLLAGVFFNFPNIDQENLSMSQLLDQIFKVLNPSFLMNSGYLLMQNVANLIVKYFPQLGFMLTCEEKF